MFLEGKGEEGKVKVLIHQPITGFVKNTGASKL